jgi:hypothetical protein
MLVLVVDFSALLLGLLAEAGDGGAAAAAVVVDDGC